MQFVRSSNEKLYKSWAKHKKGSVSVVTKLNSFPKIIKNRVDATKNLLNKLWTRLSALKSIQNLDGTLNKINMIEDCDKRNTLIDKLRNEIEQALELVKNDYCESGEPGLVDQMEMFRRALRKLNGEDEDEDGDGDEMYDPFWDDLFSIKTDNNND